MRFAGVALVLSFVTSALALASAGCRIEASVGKTTPASAAGASEWKSKIDVQHPLVGTIWSTKEARAVTPRELAADLAKAKLVLLGEKHDNSDHHVLQARLVRELTAAGRRPAVAFEMIDADEQSVVTASLLEHPKDADAIAAAVRWDRKGWPPWPEYAPIAQAALAFDLPILGANLPLAQVRAIAHGGIGAVDRETAARLGIDRELPEASAASLREELQAAHCGHLPDAAVDRMALAQRARDAEMAQRILLTAQGDGAVLIAGAGHVRNDRGVPSEVARLDASVRVVSVAFSEVEKAKTQPPEYASRWYASAVPFDYVWFTPRSSDADPCDAFRRPPSAPPPQAAPPPSE